MIAAVSVLRSPAAWEFDRRSEPARSMRFKRPRDDSPVREFWPIREREKTEWLREERSFMAVAAVARLAEARWKREKTEAGEVTGAEKKEKG